MKRKKGGACSQAASGVMHTPPRARTRVVCPPCSHTEILKESLCSHTTGARTRVREGGKAPIRDRDAYFKAWRAAKFGGDFDPVGVAVDGAVDEFSTRDPARRYRIREINVPEKGFTHSRVNGKTVRGDALAEAGLAVRFLSRTPPGGDYDSAVFVLDGAAR